MLDELISHSLLDKSYFRNPFPLFHELRSRAPIFRSEVIGGWIITRHEDCDAVLKDSENFSSKGRITHLLNQLGPDFQSELQLLHFHFARGLAHSDAPEHRRLRGLLARAFTPKMIEGLRPRIREIVDRKVSTLDSESDLVKDLLTPIPARVVGELLGSSEEDIPDLIRWAHAINGLYEKGGRISSEKALHAEKMLGEMREFVRRLVREREAKKSAGALVGDEDVIAALVMQDADALSEEELLSTAVTLFVAGHETTTHLLGNGIFALLERPQLVAGLRHDPTLIENAVEEMARFDGSVPRSWRIAKREITISGATIPAGDLVLPILAAANRDPEVFGDPDQFLPERDSRKHLAYGKGVHVCLGAPLARIEAQEIIASLLKRFSQIELAHAPDQMEWREDLALRGLLSLPVTLR
jgi:cytochrome P450